MDASCVLQFKKFTNLYSVRLAILSSFSHSKTEITGYWEYRYVLSLCFWTIYHVKESRENFEEYYVLEFPIKSKKD